MTSTIYVLEIQNVNECASNPCLNPKHCIDGFNKYTCSCTAGYTGNLCDVGKQLMYTQRKKLGTP